MPTTTPGTFDAPNVLASASSIAVRFARGNGSDVLTSAARAVAVTASSAIIRDNAKARAAPKIRMDSSALIGFFVGTHNRTPFYRFPNHLLGSQTVLTITFG